MRHVIKADLQLWHVLLHRFVSLFRSAGTLPDICFAYLDVEVLSMLNLKLEILLITAASHPYVPDCKRHVTPPWRCCGIMSSNLSP